MRGLVFLALLAGCLESSEVHCGGLICANGRVCATVTVVGEATSVCVTQDQLEQCTDDEGVAVDQMPCTFQGHDGTCHEGVCYANVCGNGVKDLGETCDDGNTIDTLEGTTMPDACASNCKSDQTCGNGVIDPINGEDCDTGDAIEHDGCSSGCRVETPTFGSLDQVNTFPYFALAFDSDRNAPMMWGGQQRSNTDMQAWVHERWRRVPSTITPQSREAKMTFDRDHHEIVLFGSTQPFSGLRDTWTFDARGWHLAQPEMTPKIIPAGIVFDAKHHRVVMVGGRTEGNDTVEESWAWDGLNWKSISMPSAFIGRTDPAVGYDEHRGVVVVFGGNQLILGAVDELWELDGDTWTQRTKQAPWPEKRYYGGLGYDPASTHMFLIGGNTVSPTWEWDGTTWTSSTGPFDMTGTMTTDLARNRLIYVQLSPNMQVFNHGADGMWTASGDPVPNISVGPDSPSERVGVAAAMNPRSGEIVAFGGTLVGGTVNDTFVWNGAWSKAPVPTSAPLLAERQGASMVYDPLRDEMVMFGGFKGSTMFGDTWTFKAGQWTSHTLATHPPGRSYAGMAWDNHRGRVVLLGGWDGVMTQAAVDALSVMWSWDGAAWTPESGAHPPLLFAPAMAYDPSSNNVVLVGGDDFTSSFTPATLGTDAMWILDETGWKQSTVTQLPPQRGHGKLAWNVARQRLELFGGETASGLVRNDLWEWNGAPTLNAPQGEWKQVTVAAPATTGHEMVGLPDGSGVALIGGGTITSTADYKTVRTIRWDNEDPREEACIAGLDYDGDGKAGCDDPDCWFDCNVECPLATSCAGGPTCGDGTCDNTGPRELEDCASCPADCGACS